MISADFSERLREIGREVNFDTLTTTRELLTPLVAQPDPAIVSISRDISYGPHERHRLDIFTPAGGKEAERPLLIFVHGGGFVAGDKHAEGSPFYSNIGQWAVQQGYNAINITYRLAPEFKWPSGIQDLHLVVNFIRQQGVEFGINADNIFLMGQSAGAAHAASYVAHQPIYAPDTHGLRGLILLSGVYVYSAADAGPMEAAYLGEDTSEYAAKSSLDGLLDSSLPLLVALAEHDPPMFERQGLLLLNAWQQRYQQLPHFVHARTQNHLSVAMSLGLQHDLVGPQLKAFIDAHRVQS